MPTRIYSYGAKAPVVGMERVAEQMLLSHRYANKLIEIERLRRQEVEKAILRHCPELLELEHQIAAVETELDATRSGMRQSNQEARARVQQDSQAARVKDLQKQIKELRTHRKATRDQVFARGEVQLELKQLDDQARVAHKEHRRQAGVWRDNYIIAEQRLKSMRSGAPPEFRRWRGDGTVGIQIAGGCSTVQAMEGTHTKIRIAPPDDNGRTIVHLRVGSDEKRRPVWAVFPVVLHRPLPEEARIKWAWIKRRRVATHDDWQFQLVLEAESFEKPDLAADGEVAVELGWRKVAGGVRVAVWKGSDGARGELLISERDAGRWTKADDLRSIRQREFDAILPEFAGWVKACPALPEWLAGVVSHVDRWRSPNRLAALVTQWRFNRFDGDEKWFDRLEVWRKQDRHIHDWAENQIRKALSWRDHYYRTFAADLRRRYRTVVLEKINWAKLARKADVADDKPDLPGPAKEMRRVATPGRLTQLLKENMQVRMVDAINTTRRCHVCGSVESFDAAAALYHGCSKCGTIWDQDDNAAENILARSVVV